MSLEKAVRIPEMERVIDAARKAGERNTGSIIPRKPFES